LAECQQIRIWRNAPDVFPMLRTGYKSEAEQAQFYHTHIAPSIWRREFWVPVHRYYAVEVWHYFAGIAGLTYIEGNEAEISLVLGPAFRGKGVGAKAVTAVLAEARRLGLQTVRGECYREGALPFWLQQVTTRQPVEMETAEDGTLKWKWGL
jgi:RimJ/RimL family protein N-acetyltransferase